MPADVTPDPEVTAGGLAMEKFSAHIRIETRKDCLARIEGRAYYPGEVDEVKDDQGRLCYIFDRDTLIRVLGLGTVRDL